MFKVGDKIEALPNNSYSITTNGWQGEVITIRGKMMKTQATEGWRKSSGSDCSYTIGWEVDNDDSKFKLIGKKSMTKLNSMMKRLLDAQTKKLIKGGLIDGDLKLTEEGKEALAAIEFEEHKAELVKIAEENIKEAKEDC